MEKVVLYEYLLILGIFITVAVTGMGFELWTRYTQKREKKLQLLIATLFSEKIEDINPFFPKRYRSLSIILPILEQIEQTITSPYWNFFKNHLLHNLLQNEIDLFLTSRSWKRTVLGLKALRLAPLPIFQDKVLSLLSDSNDIVRFRSIRAAIAYNTYKATKALIQTMSDMPLLLQFFYRDALSSSPQSIHAFILQHYRTTKNEKEKISCLKILAIASGLLTEEEILECIASDDLEKKWWGIVAVGHNPYEKGIEHLLQTTNSEMWQIQAISAYTMAVLRYKQGTPSLEPLLQSSQYWVRYTAAAALRYLGEGGEEILERAKKNGSELAKNIASYILLVPEWEFQRGIRTFFPLNLDTVLLDEEYHPKLS